MTKKTLTIIGATGFLSTTITNQLASNGVSVKAIVRDPVKARQLLSDSVEIIEGDVSDTDSLNKALEGTENLYIHLNTETTDMNLPFYTEREGVQNIVRAAKNNSVSHIMQIAGLESLHDEFFLNGVIETRQIREAGMKLIGDSGIPYTFFYCSFFADSLVRLVDDNSICLFGELPYDVFMTNSYQLAGHIYQAIDNPEALNQRYSVQGSDGMTFQEAAQRFFTIYNPDITINKLPLSTINELGLPSTDAGFLKRIWEVCDGLNEKFVSETTFKQLGKPSMGIEEFAEQLKSGDG